MKKRRKRRKSGTKEETTFAHNLRRNYCILCRGCDSVDKYGDPICTVSHIRTKGAGGQLIGNTVPMCLRCHVEFESWPAAKKRELLKEAERFKRNGGMEGP